MPSRNGVFRGLDFGQLPLNLTVASCGLAARQQVLHLRLVVGVTDRTPSHW
jgi:hypothetical protein